MTPNSSIDELELSPRIEAALRTAHIRTIRALTEKTEAELMRIEGVKSGSLTKIKRALSRERLALKTG